MALDTNQHPHSGRGQCGGHNQRRFLDEVLGLEHSDQHRSLTSKSLEERITETFPESINESCVGFQQLCWGTECMR